MFALLTLAAANVILLAFFGSYDVRFGPVHLAAANLFKPLLYLNAAFLLAIAVRPATVFHDASGPLLNRRYWLAAIAIVAAVYGVSFRINLQYTDWTHRPLTSGVNPIHFFTRGQYDGFYRPLTFLSLWIDNEIFGPALWGYHIQNVVLHLLNGALVARLAFRLGLPIAAARWSGLLFLAVPAAFEAVIWPGARFDLLAAAFTLLALELALSGSTRATLAAYALGVLSKESAYCFPLVLGALYLLRHPLALSLDPRRTFRLLASVALVTVALIGVRFAVYGRFSGKPATESAEAVPQGFRPKLLTATPTRLPAALFLVNTQGGLDIWLRIAVAVFAAALVVALACGAGLGSRAALLIPALLAAAPTLNVMGWINPAAQQGRYLYQPAVWIVIAVAAAVAPIRRGPQLCALLTACMAVAAFANTLAYVRMLDTAIATADSARRAGALPDLPADLYGAFYFRDEAQERFRRK